MNVESAEVELAYTYAWWLTGEDRAARTAVLTAVDRPDVPGADADLRLEILLRRVKAAAVSAPTMCPASELALLHDAIGIALDSAAGLAMIDAREARTELAHGRLEALGPEAEFEIVQPHRLGGLAVGNPADVAAARQNEKLAQLREMILRGRDELVDVSRVEVPAALLDAVANRRDRPVEEVPLEDGWFDGSATAPGEADAGAPSASATVYPPRRRLPEPHRTDGRSDRTDGRRELEDAEEIDLTEQVTAAKVDRSPVLERARSRRGWALLALAAVAGVAALLVPRLLPSQETTDEPTDVAVTAATTAPEAPVAAPTPASTEAATAVPPPTTTDPAQAPPTAAATAEEITAPPAEPFTVSSTGVAVGIGTDPSADNPTAGPFDPVSISVEYRGAQEGDALLVDWLVDGVVYDSERANLSPLLSTARFTKQVPEEGWPPGQHVLVLALERTGEVVGEARFQVAA